MRDLISRKYLVYFSVCIIILFLYFIIFLFIENSGHYLKFAIWRLYFVVIFLSNEKAEVRGNKIFFDSFEFVTSKYTRVIDLIGVLKTVMHYGYSGVCGETNLSSEEIYLYISQQETFLCPIPDTIP